MYLFIFNLCSFYPAIFWIPLGPSFLGQCTFFVILSVYNTIQIFRCNSHNCIGSTTLFMHVYLLIYLCSLSRYGRKPVLFAALALQTVFTFAQVFSGSWIMFLIILFINGLGQMSNFVAALVLGRMEHLFSYDAKLRARFIRGCHGPVSVTQCFWVLCF